MQQKKIVLMHKLYFSVAAHLQVSISRVNGDL